MKKIILIFMFTTTMVFLANAQIPRVISYQGVLTDSTGNPKPDAIYSMTFRLYTLPDVGNAAWTETRSIATKRGLFSAILGEVSPFPDSLHFNQQYWLGIQVGADPEMTPRVVMTSVAYSMNSLHADTSEYVKHSPAMTRPISPPITNSEIANRAVSLSKIDTAGAQENQVVTFSSGSVHWGMPSSGGLNLPYSSVTSAPIAFRVENQDSVDNYNVAVFGISTAQTGSTYGVGGISNSAGGYGSAIGTYGLATNSSGRNLGVYGATYSQTDAAVGVKGEAVSNTGATEGVRGETNGSGDYATGVVGYANSSTGLTFGVSGTSVSGTDNSAGVAGYALSFSGVTNGVYGKTNSLTSGAVGVSGNATGSSGVTNGVYGSTMSSSDGAAGVFGFTPATSGMTYGVYGRTHSLSNFTAGVNGYAARTSGISYGVYGATNSTSGGASGVYGSTDNVSGVATYGVTGKTNSSDPSSAGVYGYNNNSGKSGSLGGSNYGVKSDGDMILNGNLYVSGNITGLVGWTDFPFATGYSNSGGSSQNVQYRKIGDIVYLRGGVQKSNLSDIGSGEILGTLPTGFRPPADLIFTSWPNSATLTIHSDGRIESGGAGFWIQSFSDIFFSTTP